MNVHTEIRPRNIPHNLSGHMLRHRALVTPRKDPVHIDVKSGDASGDGIHPQRIHGRIDIHDSLHMLLLLLKNPVQLIADILPFQFIPVYAGHDTDSFFITCHLLRLYSVFIDRKPLINGEPYGCHSLYHLSYHPFRKPLVSFEFLLRIPQYPKKVKQKEEKRQPASADLMP